MVTDGSSARTARLGVSFVTLGEAARESEECRETTTDKGETSRDARDAREHPGLGFGRRQFRREDPSDELVRLGIGDAMLLHEVSDAVHGALGRDDVRVVFAAIDDEIRVTMALGTSAEFNRARPLVRRLAHG